MLFWCQVDEVQDYIVSQKLIKYLWKFVWPLEKKSPYNVHLELLHIAMAK
jgi:hypothetical protein